MNGINRSLILFILCSVLNGGGVAAAELQSESDEIVTNVYHFSWQKDAATMIAAGAGWTALSRAEPTLSKKSCPCDSTDLNVLDRRTVHNESASAAAQSNIAVAVLAPLPFLFDAWDVQHLDADWATFGADSTVIIESYLLSGMLTEGFKIGVQRPRPLTYDKPQGDPRLDVTDNYLSFYSAHTSGVFSAGMAYASTYARHHPGSTLSYAAYGAVIAAGTYVGSLRVLAGKHFPTDVAAGALFGSAVGLAWPILHEVTLFGGTFHLSSEHLGYAVVYTKDLH